MTDKKTSDEKDIPTVSPQDYFKARFIKLIKDLGENAKDNPEIVWLIGSLAGSILEDANRTSWASFKADLSQEAYSRLLASFQKQGNELAAKGNHKAAYAIETLAISTIAPTMKDKHIVEGNKLLDQMVDDAVAFYRKHPATSADVN